MHLSLIRGAGVRHTSRYTAIGAALLERFPTGTPAVDRELARTMAYLDTPGAQPELVSYMTNAGTHREDQLFTMYCLRAMKAGWEKPERDAVVKWFLNAQDQKWRGGASFPGYMRDMWKETLTVFPEDERKAAEEAMEAFAPAPVITSTGRPQQLGDDATRLSIQELREYMTLDPMAYTGDAARGEQVFQKALCSACHKHGELGQEAGPDLTYVAQRFGRNDLLDAILTPSKSISDQWASVEIVTRGKKVVSGVIVSEDADTVVVQPVGAAQVSVPVKDIQTRAVAKVSPMPEGLLNTLTLREISDLLAFLERSPGN
jgi:putative heme-binding domain-containing protein